MPGLSHHPLPQDTAPAPNQPPGLRDCAQFPFSPRAARGIFRKQSPDPATTSHCITLPMALHCPGSKPYNSFHTHVLGSSTQWPLSLASFAMAPPTRDSPCCRQGDQFGPHSSPVLVTESSSLTHPSGVCWTSCPDEVFLDSQVQVHPGSH